MKLLVTAGPTREPIDAVRFISNPSTGKMGAAVAARAFQRGHEVCLVTGPVSLELPPVRVVRVTTAEEMLRAVGDELAWCEALVMTAAVADCRPASPASGKLPKTSLPSELALGPTPDILLSIRQQKGTRLFVGFAAQCGDPVPEARLKLEAKGLDLIVANDISRDDSGFGSDTNRVTLIPAGGSPEPLPLLTKEAVADRILDWLEDRSPA